MKYLFTLYCAALLATITPVAGQTSTISSEADIITFMNSDQDYIQNQKELYTKIEGSAYLDVAFHDGSISYSQKKYKGLQLRFNPYEGYFEFQTDQGIKYIDPRITPIDTVWLEKDTYIYVPYKLGKAMKRDYMKIMYRGATRVLQLSQVILIQPEPAKGYQDAKIARFEQRENEIFIQTGNQVALKFKGKKSLEEIFPEHHSQLLKYVKSEKLKLKNVEDVVQLCHYYDSML